MIVGWMAYSILIAGVAALAAHLLESAARLVGRPTRWLWVAAMMSTASASAAAMFNSVAFATRFLPRKEAAPWLTGPAGTFIGYYERLMMWDPTISVVLWVASGCLACVFAISIVRLLKRSSTWRRTEVDGHKVLVSATDGPAVIGFVRSAIVLPEWALAEGERVRRLIIAHEREHQRSGDHLLCLLTVALTVAQPWNPAVWWMARRLRLAIEVDCDARVLDHGSDRRAYGLLLLEAGSRAAGCRLPVPAFSTPLSSLEERLRIIMAERRSGRSRAVKLSFVAVVLVTTAAFVPDPTSLHCVLRDLGFCCDLHHRAMSPPVVASATY
ncbi:MAG TPA: M56 family metallopeptidase [Gemmatimonadaceae bacterium]|nr:M56 family metallopeptidase [Gemmatimonadaceae bacterium]